MMADKDHQPRRQRRGWFISVLLDQQINRICDHDLGFAFIVEEFAGHRQGFTLQILSFGFGPVT